MMRLVSNLWLFSTSTGFNYILELITKCNTKNCQNCQPGINTVRKSIIVSKSIFQKNFKIENVNFDPEITFDPKNGS